MCLFCRLGANPPQGAVCGQEELAGWITESQLQFVVSAREAQIAARNPGGAAHGFSEPSLSAVLDACSGPFLAAVSRWKRAYTFRRRYHPVAMSADPAAWTASRPVPGSAYA